MPAVEFDREMTSGHFVRMYKFSHDDIHVQMVTRS